jgi:hypothetical protein
LGAEIVDMDGSRSGVRAADGRVALGGLSNLLREGVRQPVGVVPAARIVGRARVPVLRDTATGARGLGSLLVLDGIPGCRCRTRPPRVVPPTLPYEVPASGPALAVLGGPSI